MKTQASTQKSKLTKKTVKHDAIVLLKNDHAEAKKLFKQFEKLAEDDDIEGKTKLANLVCAELVVHTTVEEEIFYPAVREAIEDDDLLNEATVEHASAKDLIIQILSMNPEDPMYDAKVKVLGEYVNHHVEEEESEMFPEVRESKKLDLKAMGEQLQARKDELMEQLMDLNGDIDASILKTMVKGSEAVH